MVSVAIYVRLSDEDKDKPTVGFEQHETDESESIKNQKAMLSDYCKERNWSVFDIYCDEDYSGIDRNRPAFNRMLTDCKNGYINIVLCKSQSRFSRDMEVIEKYIHNKFLEWNVRFIGVVDQADSFDAANKKARQINGLVNEWYLEDVSENIRKTLQNKKKRGEFTGSSAPYGYSIDPTNKNHLIVDENAASVVREIFDWFLQGWGYRKIVMALNERAIPSPTLYKKQNNSNYANWFAANSISKGMWTQSSVYGLVRNETYTGTLVQGKEQIISYKNKKRRAVPEEDWIKVPDCHEPIIDKHTWERAKERIRDKTRACKTTQTIWILSGKVKCEVCGASMKRNIYYNKKRTIRYYNLICSTYKYGAMNCTNKSIITGLRFEALLVEQINVWVKNYCNQDKVEIESEHEVKLARINSESEAVCMAIAKIEERTTGLYEDKLDGVITKEEFISFKRKYEKEIAELTEKLSKFRRQTQAIQQMTFDDVYRKQLIEKYTCIDKLTRLIAEEFIEAVLIGGKTEEEPRKVTVHWKL